MIRQLLIVIICCFSLPLLANEQSVGDAVFVIGQVKLIRNGQVLTVKKGEHLIIDDQLNTSDNGQIIIHFVDGGKVSLRPNSQLHIDNYLYDINTPKNSYVKFTLLKGILRSISGDAAHKARNHFRLNTPLVAIGVRGTDFFTKTDTNSTMVLVNEGAIVLAPLGQSCSATSYGACSGKGSKLLSANMANTALIYMKNTPEPIYQPYVNVNGANHISSLTESNTSSNQSNSNQSLTQSIASVSQVNVTPISSQIQWGRWPTNALPGDHLTVPFSQALQGRYVTVGDGYFFLFRNTPNFTYSSTQANQPIQLNLNNSYAYFRSNANQILGAQVNSGSLSVNLQSNSFTTQLSLSSSFFGNQSLQSSGTLNSKTGIFIGQSQDTHVAGALSNNALQAGYLFSKSLSSGTIYGATQWSR